MLSNLINDDSGNVVCAELVLVLSVGVLGCLVGSTAIRDAVSRELNDVSQAFGSVSQTFAVSGLIKPRQGGDPHAFSAGFGFVDDADDCDGSPVVSVDISGQEDFGFHTRSDSSF